MEDNHDWKGYSNNWDLLRKITLKRDDHTCQRCREERGPLQAHHIIPRSQGGSDTLDNLITLCRPCHAVQHPENQVFDDSRPDATLFPRPNAPKEVAKMRTPDDRVCRRCRKTIDDCENLIAYDVRPHQHLMLCKPCAGVVYDHVACDAGTLRANHRFPIQALIDDKHRAPFQPSPDADAAVAIERFRGRTDHTTTTQTETEPAKTQTAAESENLLSRIFPRKRLKQFFESWKALASLAAVLLIGFLTIAFLII